MKREDLEAEEKYLRDRLEQLHIKPKVKPEPLWPYLAVMAVCLAAFGIVWYLFTGG